MMMKYVLGFCFDEDYKSVLLIRKAKPDWQAGKLNGIGGKIEEGESPKAAMIREFYEEADLKINSWEPTITMQGDDWIVHCFRSQGAYSDFQYSETLIRKEMCIVCNVNKLPNDVIPNLHWLIPLHLDIERNYKIWSGNKEMYG